MIGAILGDIIGSPYEFDRGSKRKDFPLFSEESTYTDDTVMTLAVAKAFLEAQLDASDDLIMKNLADWMRQLGKMYPNAGYGGRFRLWLRNPECQAYNSFGNGSAMRVSSAAWLYNDIDAVRHAARLSAEVTHNHPEGIKGAEATASAIFLARTGHSKAEIKEYIENEFGYALNRTCDEIRPDYYHTETCMETVPEAITAFLEGDSFEDVIRTVVSLGGDCDTLTAIAGSIAEGFYGVPDELKEECYHRLPEPLLNVLKEFEEYLDRNVAMNLQISKSQITLVNGSCADQEVDVVVNAANGGLWAGGGICGVIFKKAGMRELSAACNKYQTPVKDGGAVITPAFNMRNAKAIIHAVGPDFGRTPSAFKELFEAYYNSLVVLKENGYHSISFPLISAGIFGGNLPNPVAESTKQCCRAYNKFVQDFPDYIVDVKLCAFFSSEMVEAKKEFRRTLI